MTATPADQVRFRVAGLEVLLRSAQPDGLASLGGYYREYPPAGQAPGLVLDIERVAGFGEGRARGPEYPGFRRRLIEPGVIALERFDAEGEIRLPDEPVGDAADSTARGEPVRGWFRVGESPNTIEAAVRIGMSIALPRIGGLLLHASAIALERGKAMSAAPGDRADDTSALQRERGDATPTPNGWDTWRALVFAGVSGAGKSTISSMLADALPHVIKISDELLILAPAAPPGSGWMVHVAPFIGGRGLPHGAVIPAAGLHFLTQAPHHRRTRVDTRRAVRELMRHVLAYVADSDTASRALAAAHRAASAIPCFHLEFAKDPGVAEVLGVG